MGGRRGRIEAVVRAATVTGLAVAVTACGPEVDYSAPPERPVCPDGAGASSVDIGHVSVVGARIGYFRTTGGEVHLEATNVHQGGFLDSTVTQVLVGTPARPPLRDAGGALETDPVARARVVDRSYGTVTLPAGIYWVTASNGGYITVSSCRPGGVAPIALDQEGPPAG